MLDVRICQAALRQARRAGRRDHSPDCPAHDIERRRSDGSLFDRVHHWRRLSYQANKLRSNVQRVAGSLLEAGALMTKGPFVLALIGGELQADSSWAGNGGSCSGSTGSWHYSLS